MHSLLFAVLVSAVCVLNVGAAPPPVDVCDVPGGDGTSCLDCLGIQNGPHVYDGCDVCAGDSSTCADCAGVPHGAADYDVCGVCAGDGLSCAPRDCAGVPGGSAVVDACGVCGGGSAACLGCAPERRDACGACFGDSTTCTDCAGTVGGTATVDACGVCGGANLCFDCAGDPFGTLVIDACGVCGGSNSTCADDCAGVRGGTSQVDACGVCNGDNACLDCAGTPLGFAAYDACDVCDGDASTCADCRGAPNGPAVLDECGVCGGDGAPCRVDAAGRPLDAHGRPVDPNTGLPLNEAAPDRFVGDTPVHTGTVLGGVALGVGALLVGAMLCAFVRPRSRSPPSRRRRVPERRIGQKPLIHLAVVMLVLCAGATAAPPPLHAEERLFFAELCAETSLGVSVPGTCVDAADACDWPGIECHTAMELGAPVRRVRTLHFHGVYAVPLSGELPMHALGRLRTLAEFSVRNHALLRVALPPSVAEAQNVEVLELHDVDMRDTTVPTTLATLVKLHTLRLTQSRLSGTLPSELVHLNALQHFSVRQNALSGADAVPPWLDNWLHLVEYDVRANALGGTLPGATLERIGAEGTIETFLLSSNDMSGTLPTSVGSLTSLRRLELSAQAGVSGTLPTELGALTRLESLHVGTLGVSGTLPSELGALTSLRELDVAANDLSGTLPSELLLLGPLRVALFHSNRFESPLPAFTEMHVNDTALPPRHCTFADNHFCAPFPPATLAALGDECVFGELAPTECGTCGDRSCFDCNGVANGPDVYDACGVCGGDNATCADCAGVPNGNAAIDVCGECGGAGVACLDCAGTPNGTLIEDVCGECGGAGTACLDCGGAVNGTRVYDACDVCDGDGSSCAGDGGSVDDDDDDVQTAAFVVVALCVCLLCVGSVRRRLRA